jgi:hypothetical protein
MPKSTPWWHYLRSRLGLEHGDVPKPPETAIYEPDGTYVLHRKGNDVFRRGTRVYYIRDNWVFDESGAARFYIVDQWWYTTEGKQAYYQHEVIPKDWEKWLEEAP